MLIKNKAYGSYIKPCLAIQGFYNVSLDNFNDVKASIWDARKARAITPLQKDILFKLLFLTRKGGFRCPGHKLIAKMACACERTVRTALKRAEALGLLTIIHRRKKVGNRWWNDTNAHVFHALREIPASTGKFCRTGYKDIKKKSEPPVDNSQKPKKQAHLEVQEYLAIIAGWQIEKQQA